MNMIRITVAVVFLLWGVSGQASTGAAEQVAAFPRVVLYTAPWCANCTAAKEYLARNNIPFVKKDIADNGRYLEEMTTRYKSRAVPVIVIGNDQKVLRGFIRESFQRAFAEVCAAKAK
ncbi:glutaredoxin domain-containing protein [Geotalea sp. SG265]|uniref:glutaredoxin domain-containing protein n=1 Tax=Geotalea sp. SG265 TaxID=2922867 RepID=UPI001FB01603|nr:glutaredoxin domain-containing protein [Geotalea sp. SG265]